jgi:CheY-like chemotaxis protein
VYFIMAIGLALLVSADPVTIQQFSHALQELSISPDVCQEVPAAVGLLNRRKFDAVIVDLQLGEQSGLILDEVRLSPSNRTAVTFAISGSDAEGTAFRKKVGVCLRETAFYAVNPQHTQACLRTDPERTAALFPVSHLYSRHHPETKHARSSLQQREHQRRGHGLSTFVPLSPGEKYRFSSPYRVTKLPFLAESTICWLKTGHLGVRFVSPFRRSTNPSYRAGYHESWKRCFRNSLPGR